MVVVDAVNHLGGAYLNQGTIPSKTLREAILDLTGFLNRSYYGSAEEASDISINDLNFRLHKVIEDQNALIARQFAKNDIECVHGFGRFVSDECIEVVDRSGEVLETICADRFLVATNAAAQSGKASPLTAKSFSTQTAFSTRTICQSLCWYWVGASSAVSTGRCLPRWVRRSRWSTAQSAYCRCWIRVLHSCLANISSRWASSCKCSERLRNTGEDGLEVETEEGEVLRAQCLFYALGRTANVETLQLERASVCQDARGYINVNPLFQSSNPRVYAAGDVIGQVSLASTAMEEGRLAVRNAFALKTHQFPEFFPYGIYTIPEVSGVGPTEEELKAQDVNYQVGLAYYYELGRGPIAGDTTGMFKLIFHAETLRSARRAYYRQQRDGARAHRSAGHRFSRARPLLYQPGL